MNWQTAFHPCEAANEKESRMTIFGYLCKKYGNHKYHGLSHAEAKAFGISWPLKSGWKAKHGNTLITDAMSAALTRKLSTIANGPSEGRAARATSGLGALKSAPERRPTAPSVRAFISRSFVDPTSDAFLESFEWRALRVMALKQHGARCQCCGASPATGATVNVDHIQPRKFFPELALALDNLQVLCNECNHGKGNWDHTDWRAAA